MEPLTNKPTNQELKSEIKFTLYKCVELRKHIHSSDTIESIVNKNVDILFNRFKALTENTRPESAKTGVEEGVEAIVRNIEQRLIKHNENCSLIIDTINIPATLEILRTALTKLLEK